MKKSILLVAMAAILCGYVGAQEQDKSVWFADFDAAAAEAKKSNKDILVDFTGSDWCGWCIKLDNEVFEHEAFLTPTQKSYVLLKLDYPNGDEAKAKVPNPARNEELMGKYGVQGFPTILMMDADGEVFARTGYQAGGPEAYVKHMNEISAKGKTALKAAKEIAKEFEAAEGDAVAAVVVKALDFLEKADEETVGLMTVAKVARHALEMDADNAKGLKVRALKGLMKTGQAENADLDAARTLDPKNEKGLLEYCVMAEMNNLRSEDDAKAMIPKLEAIIDMGVKAKANKEMIFANAAFFNLQIAKNKEKAEKYAKMLQAIPELDPRFNRLIEMVLGGDHDESGDDEGMEESGEDEDGN